MLRRYFAWIEKSPRAAALLSLSMVAVVGYLDALTYKLVFSFFYLFPVITSTWSKGADSGLRMSILSATVSLAANFYAGMPGATAFHFIWNALMRLAVLATVAVLLDAFKALLQREAAFARHDPLTGIANRRYLFETLEKELHRAARNGEPLSLAYLDLDDFKRLNDREGHAIGDAALKVIARELVTSARDIDLPARLGGDEFAVLLPGTSQPALTHFIERLRPQLAQAIAAQGWSVGASIGAITIERPGLSADEALRAADTAMYRAKMSGKNGTCFAVQR